MTHGDLQLAPLPGFDPEIGRWLWALEDVRRVLMAGLAGVSREMLDYQPPGTNGIGTLLYHIAAIEASWLYEDVLNSPLPPEVEALFPIAVRTAGQRLTPVTGETLSRHTHRLDTIRAILLSHFREMTAADWRRPRVYENYTVTPEWAIYHLIEHEAHHRGQIFALRQSLSAGG